MKKYDFLIFNMIHQNNDDKIYFSFKIFEIFIYTYNKYPFENIIMNCS